MNDHGEFRVAPAVESGIVVYGDKDQAIARAGDLMQQHGGTWKIWKVVATVRPEVKAVEFEARRAPA